MSHIPVSREDAAKRLAEIVAEFIRAHGGTMSAIEQRSFADNIRDGNEAVFFTEGSSTLSYVSFDPKPDEFPFRPITAFSRTQTGMDLDDEFDALLPKELIKAVMDEKTLTVRQIMTTLAAWYQQKCGTKLPQGALDYLPKGILKGMPYGWYEHGFSFHFGPPDVNGYILRITEARPKRSAELGHYTVFEPLRNWSLEATACIIEAIGGVENYPGRFEPINPADAKDLPAMIAMIVRWWFPQEFTLARYPTGEEPAFVQALRDGNEAILLIRSNFLATHRVVVSLPDADGNVVRLESFMEEGKWKPIAYATECLNLAVDQTVGREAVVALFKHA